MDRTMGKTRGAHHSLVTKQKVNKHQSVLSVFRNLLRRLQQVAIQIWVAQLSNSPRQTCNKVPRQGCATKVYVCHQPYGYLTSWQMQPLI